MIHIYLFIFISAYNEYLIYSLFPFLTERYFNSDNDKILYYFLLLTSVYGMGRIIGYVLWKYLDIKIKIKKLVRTCLFLSIVIYLIWGFSVNIYMLVITRFVMGVVCSNFEIIKKFIKQMSNDNSNTYEIKSNIFMKVGDVCGLFLGSYLYIYKIPGTENFPLLTNGIISSIIITILLLYDFLVSNNYLILNCFCNCKCNDNNDFINPLSYTSSDSRESDSSDNDSDNEISTGVENNNENNNGNNNINIARDSIYKFIFLIVYFSGVYNSYKYLVILYLYYYSYGVLNITNILAIIECFGYFVGFILQYFNNFINSYDQFLYVVMIILKIILFAFFPYIIKITDYNSLRQIVLIIFICCVNEFAYNIILIINNNILKKYPTRNMKWKIYYSSIFLTQIATLLIVTALSFLMIYTGSFNNLDTETENNNTSNNTNTNNNSNPRKFYIKNIIDEYTPFYVLSILYIIFLIYYKLINKYI